MKKFKLTTPHAAIKIWNYLDRVQATGSAHSSAAGINDVKEEIISTVSCSSISTTKAKSNPIGTFNFTLAPTRNWTAAITPGSWCAVMMSNEPITENDFKYANPKLVKMIGKIATVRTSVTTNPDGARVTQYLVAGEDWGHIFEDVLYVDPLIIGTEEDANSMGNSIFQQLIPILAPGGSPTIASVRNNLQQLLNCVGEMISAEGKVEGRLAKNSHSLLMPKGMRTFLFGEEDKGSERFMTRIKLISGALRATEGKYDVQVPDGDGFIDPMSLIGTNNIWQVLQDNGNYAINELFNDILWTSEGPQFTLYNRVKPFAFREEPISDKTVSLRSKFRLLPTHRLDPVTIKSVNVGTNWRDKFNFVQIQPIFQDFKSWENLILQKVQAWDRKGQDVFNREGFRPLVFSVKQLPCTKHEVTILPITGATDSEVNYDAPSPTTPAAPGTRKLVEGFYRGNSFALTICSIDGAAKGNCWVADQASVDTQMWFNEARQAGLMWGINASYRTTKEQQHEVTTQPKLAAAVGFSPHQSGRGLDIQPFMHATAVKCISKEGMLILDQLEAIGNKYGWVRDARSFKGPSPTEFNFVNGKAVPVNMPADNDEPWHFTYHRWTPEKRDPFVPPTMPTITVAGVTRPGATDDKSAAKPTGTTTTWEVDPLAMEGWTGLLQEWYFDTHRLLNGQIVMTGSSEYISVGNNIMFDAELLGVKPNYNYASAADPSKKYYLLAHVECVKNSFQVGDDGARTFQTVIDFVRGIIVDENKNLVGDGALDTINTLPTEDLLNDRTVVTTSHDYKMKE